MDAFRRHQNRRVQVGGLHCSCCNYYHGKDKPILNRWARRDLKANDTGMIEDEMEQYWYGYFYGEMEPTVGDELREIEQELFDLDRMEQTEDTLKRIKDVERMQKYYKTLK